MKRSNIDKPSNKQTVWDAPVRILHWCLVASMAAAWITSDSAGPAHEYIGYGIGAIIAARLAWGFKGNRYARFTHFVRSPASTLDYLGQALRARAPRHIGHNPLGGWMVVAFMVCIALVVFSGWLLNTDLLWGYAWPVRLHAALAWIMVALIGLHVAGVIITSLVHRENLIAAMFTGKKEAAGENDTD